MADTERYGMLSKATALSRSERRLVRDFFDRGYDAFYDMHLDDDEIAVMLSRPEVQAEIARVTQEFDDRRSTMEKIRHRMRLDLSKLGPLAVGVLQQALSGRFPRKNPETGEMETVLPPDKGQIEAAREVLHNLGIDEKIQDVGEAEVQVFVDNRQVNLSGGLDADTSSAAESRERVRTFLESVIAQARGTIIDKGEAHVLENHPVGGNGNGKRLKVKKKKKKKRKKVE